MVIWKTRCRASGEWHSSCSWFESTSLNGVKLLLEKSAAHFISARTWVVGRCVPTWWEKLTHQAITVEKGKVR